jgi:hypothetical protein
VDASLAVQVVTACIALVGVIWGLIELTQARRQQRLELGNLYIQRYWSIDDDLLKAPKGSKEHQQAQHRYLRFCEDEFEAAIDGWLDLKQWRVWHRWLTHASQQTKLRGDLDLCDPQGERFEHLRACLARPSGHDWEDCGGVARDSRDPDPRAAGVQDA